MFDNTLVPPCSKDDRRSFIVTRVERGGQMSNRVCVESIAAEKVIQYFTARIL